MTTPTRTPQRRGGRHRRPSRIPRRLGIVMLGALAAISAAAGVRMLHREPVVAAPNVGLVPSAAPSAPAAGVTPAVSTEPPRPRGAAERPEPTLSPAAPDSAPSRQALTGPPFRLSIPDAGVTAPVVPIGARHDGSLVLPSSPRTVGWWIGSAAAGDRRDGTLLAGHVDSAREGVGALAALRTLAPGARITVTDAFGGRHGYAVVARRTYPKYALPAEVFGIGGRPGLTLVTCGGPFNPRTGQYRDNVVVYATPLA